MKTDRTRQAHNLKTWPEYFEAINLGFKTFEIRKDDRDFQVGDYLHLHEYDPNTHEFTNRHLVCSVRYVMRNAPQFGLQDGFCIMGIKLPQNHQHVPKTPNTNHE